MQYAAVLITCFNRVQTTLKCLKALFDAELPENDSNKVGYFIPEHLQYFNKKSICMLIKCASFNEIALYKGMPLINSIYNYTNRLPPLPMIHLTDKMTEAMGFHGYSLFIYASKIH